MDRQLCAHFTSGNSSRMDGSHPRPKDATGGVGRKVQGSHAAGISVGETGVAKPCFVSCETFDETFERTDLASKFSQAAQTGQMPDLQPPGQQQGASGHHHHPVKSYQDSTGTSASGQGKPSTDLAQIIQTALAQSGE